MHHNPAPTYKDIELLLHDSKADIDNELLKKGLSAFNLINAAKELVPQITLNNIQKSKKVGIRAQLFNIDKKELINDFIYEKRENSIHILNAISPAFTSSFSLAEDLISKQKFISAEKVKINYISGEGQWKRA